MKKPNPRCDGRPDCGDGSDEKHCGEPTLRGCPRLRQGGVGGRRPSPHNGPQRVGGREGGAGGKAYRVPICLSVPSLPLPLVLPASGPPSVLHSFFPTMSFLASLSPSSFSVCLTGLPPAPPPLSVLALSACPQTVASRAPRAASWVALCPQRESGRGRPASRSGADTSVGGPSSLTAG